MTQIAKPDLDVATTGWTGSNLFQSVDLGDIGTDDTFTLTYDSVEGDSVAFNTIDAPAVLAGLESIAALIGNVVVTEDTPGTAYTVEFIGSLATTALALSVTSPTTFTPLGTGGYTDGVLAVTDFFALLDETIQDDADFINSVALGAGESSDVVKFGLGTILDPGNAPMTLRVAIAKPDGATAQVDFSVELQDTSGPGQISTWSTGDLLDAPEIGAGARVATLTVTPTEVDAIADFTALEVWITASSPVL